MVPSITLYQYYNTGGLLGEGWVGEGGLAAGWVAGAGAGVLGERTEELAKSIDI